jgi:hypothetical protein
MDHDAIAFGNEFVNLPLVVRHETYSASEKVLRSKLPLCVSY